MTTPKLLTGDEALTVWDLFIQLIILQKLTGQEKEDGVFIKDFIDYLRQANPQVLEQFNQDGNYYEPLYYGFFLLASRRFNFLVPQRFRANAEAALFRDGWQLTVKSQILMENGALREKVRENFQKYREATLAIDASIQK